MVHMRSLLLDCVQSDAADKSLHNAIFCGSRLLMVEACVTCDLVATGVGAMFPLHM